MASTDEQALAEALRPLRQALISVADVLACGREKHPDDDGFRQPPQYHVNRARQHLDAMERGVQTEDNLAHAACRLLMALQGDRASG